jgi:trimeric autotransporter adhesin
MKSLNRSSLVLITALVAIGGTAYGQVPNSNDTSDSNGNTGMGAGALSSLTTGQLNTASGNFALFSNTTGWRNTASGYAALYNNTTGNYNTATGNSALFANVSGSSNTAVGDGALNLNYGGHNNTASGANALAYNTGGNNNTASGYGALSGNDGGNNNTASGAYTLYNSMRGNNNAAFGTSALSYNLTGNSNTAAGYKALYGNTSGSSNVAVGSGALKANTTGLNNIALGYQAGIRLTTGNNNVEIGNLGVAADHAVIRIGTQGTQKATYLAGVRGVNVTGGVPVMVTATGQLGVVSSSRRYKEDIRSMGNTSNRLLKLRPVTFRYKQPDDRGQKPEQYGLIAEEVAKVMPELVIYNDKGQPETVAYQTLAPLLLNELQREHSQLRTQRTEVETLHAEVGELRRLTAQLATELRVVRGAPAER